MRQHLLGVLAIATALLAAPSLAQQTEDFEGNYDPTRTYEPNAPAGPSTWHDVMLLPPGEQAPFDAAIRADRRYVDGMRRHHEGAVTMSEAYLRDPASSSPRMRRLARAIIANQRYEIALMDDVARRLEEPVRILDLGITRLAIRAMATENLGQHWRVLPVPIPGPLDPAGPVSARDVQFAKGMIEHHAAALDMARG
ncbi:DUF305 domain-containing protein [Roseicella aerolata]|uniref:DUF305 domain-containing protein n=1 Tax=Roseicella aerolata TaxID=2883479 RepID=A0A9X1ICI9_9PROT|nr:DUF305 domain-containing protein [Roseicella aerolata]MCB4821429.1 DUF305 domain-containing protein [Roseicella aerolata]